KLTMLQGTHQSAISFGDVIPVEDRAVIISPIISTLKAEDSLKAFYKGAFQRNNWKDEDVFHRMEPNFKFPKYFGESMDISIGEDRFGAEIFQYVSSIFPSIKTLDIQASDRKIMELTDTYHSYHTQFDFILVPRVVTTKEYTGDKVDIFTGRTITASMFKQRSLKGDMSLKDVLGYQKVKDSLGNPVTYVDKFGNTKYIYKLINLWGDGQYATEYYQ